MNKNGAPAEAQRSGFELERRSKGAERSFKAAPKRDRLETEWSGFRPDDGGVTVSTGVWRRDQRAAAPDRHKTGQIIKSK